jgi:hypothetical protein
LNARRPEGKGLALAVTLLALAAPVRAEPLSATEATREAPAFGDGLWVRALVRPTLLDYEIPGHPRVTGRSNTGTIGRATLLWRASPALELEVGVLGRIPFAVILEEEVGAFPLLSLTARPFGPALSVRFGSLDLHHGFHPAVLDEVRYAYGRPIEETYNQSLVPAARRELGADLRMPVEHGAQAVLSLDALRVEAYLDWQLLETREHREKFAFGALAELRTRFGEAGAQARVVHYGGQLFTQQEEIRRLGLDPKRQPTTLAAYVRPRLAPADWLTLAAPVTLLVGRAVQTPGAREESHRGLELGLDLGLFSAGRLGYRLWLPEGGRAAFLGEDGDPVYAGPRSHRAILELEAAHGLFELASRLDLLFSDGADRVQYLLVSTLTLRWEAPLWRRDD